MTEKKAAPKKAAPAKAEAEAKAESKKNEQLSVSEVAELLFDGSRQWGTGRDRDTNLMSAGYDLNEIREATEAIRAERLSGG
jgi:hypothetical protein